MPLSRAQQIAHFRPMVNRAWLAHCYRECITDSTHASKDAWYREQLRKCFGFDTTKRCNKSGDFEKAMAWFEDLADAGIVWQLRLQKGDQVRCLHLLAEAVKTLRLTDDYVNRIMNQMDLNKPLRDCTAEELLNLRIALLTHVRRKQDRVLTSHLKGPGPATG